MALNQIGSFNAKADDGTLYTIYVYQDFPETRTGSGSSSAPRLKMVRTASGENVNVVAKGRYEVVRPFGNLRLTSDDPQAL